VPSLDLVLDQLHGLSEQAKGQRFEELCVWLLESEPMFATRKAWGWSQGRGHRLARDGIDVGADIGIDIVVETESGELWAAQAKCYAETATVSTDDINSFVACAATGEFSHLLLIATTDHVARVGSKKLQQARNPTASILRLEDLRAFGLDDWPAADASVRAAARHPRAMCPHQVAALRDVVEFGFGISPGRKQRSVNGRPRTAVDGLRDREDACGSKSR
jgi:predicted helicase